VQEELVLLVDCWLLFFWRHHQLVDGVVRLGHDRESKGRHFASTPLLLQDFFFGCQRLSRRCVQRSESHPSELRLCGWMASGKLADITAVKNSLQKQVHLPRARARGIGMCVSPSLPLRPRPLPPSPSKQAALRAREVSRVLWTRDPTLRCSLLSRRQSADLEQAMRRASQLGAAGAGRGRGTQRSRQTGADDTSGTFLTSVPGIEAQRHTFSKVLNTVALYSKYTIGTDFPEFV
jgi:hypothetical protein